jgi:choline dehydrogenase-like flavoprotein
VAERQRFLADALAGPSPCWRGLEAALRAIILTTYVTRPAVAAALGIDDRCLDHSPPRDGPRLSPRAHPEIRGDVRLGADVVVVGSGAGGAVVAKELAERGLGVVVVEEGAYFTRADFAGPALGRVRRLYRDGGLSVALGRPLVPIPLGRAVGGTTVVNSGTCFRAPAAVLRAWESRWGIDGASPGAMAPLYARVEQTINVQPVPEALLGANARVFRRGVEALGLHARPIHRNVVGCRGCGTCPLGCPSDAKQAMHLSYLPRAESAGARIYARCRVREILVERGRASGIRAEILDEAEVVHGRLTVRADAVVLAAGAIHTPLLLLETGLARRGGAVGAGLRLHPAVSVSAVFDEDVFAWRGTLQPLFVDDYQESHGILIEVTAPVPGLSPIAVHAIGGEAKAAVAAYPRIASTGLFVTDTASGRVRRFPGGRPLLTYQLHPEDARRLAFGIGVAARIFFAAGAREVHTGIAGVRPLTHPRELQDLQEPVRPSVLSVAGFHPVGTAAMGRDVRRCPVQPSGETRLLPHLWIADGSIFPDCPGVNPQLTIMAMATRIAVRIAERLGAGDGDA